MVAALKTPVIHQSKQLLNGQSNRYTQLEIYSYILESRTPTLKELCDRLPNYNPPKVNKSKKPRRIIPDRERVYPKDWINIARTFKEEKNYICQICKLQCLRPEDNREHLTPSQIGKLTANTHHIDGNTFNNLSSNLLVVCSTHHLQIHRGGKSNSPKGQGYLFDLSSI